MEMEIEIPYSVTGVLPQRRNSVQGAASFRKSYDLREIADEVELPPAYTLTRLGSLLSLSRNVERHDVRATAILDGRPWMAVEFDGAQPPEVVFRYLLTKAVRRRVSRFVGLNREGADPVDPSKFRSIITDSRLQSEQIADETISRMMMWRGQLWQRDVIPMYAVRVGDRPDVSVVPSSSARYNFFDHFLPEDRGAAMDLFASSGGNGELPVITAGDEFSYEREMYRPLIARSAKDLIEAMEDGIYADCVGRWRLRLGGEKLLKAAELIESRYDDETLPFGDLSQALQAIFSVAADLRPAPDDGLTAATAMARHRIDTLLRLLSAEQANQLAPTPR
ncbi:hypothetical protein ACVIGB_000375 [Bradyrhizobium sp. USDA 4341]